MTTLVEKLTAIAGNKLIRGEGPGTSPKVKAITELQYHRDMENQHREKAENYVPGSIYHIKHNEDAESHKKKADKLRNLIQKRYPPRFGRPK